MATAISSKPQPNLAAAKLKTKIRPPALRPSPGSKKSQASTTNGRQKAPSAKKKPDPEPVSTFKGPSLFAILSTKRLVKRFREKVAARKAEREALAAQMREPTYRMEPKRKFCCDDVKLAVEEIAEDRLGHQNYSAKKCAMITKILSEEIKDKIKRMGYERYKIVCYITLGEKQGQGMRMTSRCSWDTCHDNSVTYNYENKSMFCCITVFGLYQE